MPLLVNNKVIRLQISKDNFLSEQIIQQANHGGNIELSIVGAEEPDITNNIIKALPGDVVEENQQVVVHVDCVVELGEEGMAERADNLEMFFEHVCDVLLLDLLLVIQLPDQLFLPVGQVVAW